MNFDNSNNSYNSINQRHNNASFNRTQIKTVDSKNITSEQKRIAFEREKLEKLMLEKIEEVDKKEANSRKNLKNNKKAVTDTGVIPSISLKEYVSEKSTPNKKESFISKIAKKLKEISEKKKNEKQKRMANKKNAIEKKELEKEKIRKEKIAKLIEKNEILRQKEETAEANKKLAKEERKREKLRKKEEKNQIRYNSINEESKKINVDKKLLKEEKIAKKKEAKRLKEEKHKLLVKEKYDRELERKKVEEEKRLKLIKERQERKNKIDKEKEQARRDRKEKALLIKKAQEESKQKEKNERKTFEEKVKDWYNNLSFVKDRQNRRELQRQTLLLDFEGADAVRSEEKVTYKYVAKNGETGKVETGYFEAFSKLDVHSFLLADGYEVYEITPYSNLKKPLALAKIKFKPNELDFFLTQLSTFLKSGITLVDSVKILSKQSSKKNHKSVYKSIIYELTMGENFSEALNKQGDVFPRLLINMVKTSELTGDLPETLDDMADYYRETEKTRKQMVSAITYPVVVLLFAVVVLFYIMISVIPQFVSIYSDLDAELPRITVVVVKMSSFLKNNWMYIIAGVIAFILIFAILFKTIKVFKTIIQSLLMHLPVFGKIIIYNEITMFTKTFASLLNHNVYITDCMEVLSKITNNEVYKMLIFDTITNLAKGEAISNSFKNHWAFPNIAYEMILTGEKTGQLGNMMDKVAKYYQEQHKNAINQIKAFIEPIMIVILAIIVGVVLLSVVLPMFDMYEGIA